MDTPSLDLFAANVSKLLEPINKAASRLSATSVQPGGFYHANKMRTAVTGLNADDGLKKQYLDVLTALGKGLTDLRGGIVDLSHKYTTFEEANKLSATDLSHYVQSAQGDFDEMMKANGGGSGSGGNNPAGTPA
ncbi:hypothetical protein ACWGJX_40250 [Streptomyces sp. NPDC054775]